MTRHKIQWFKAIVSHGSVSQMDTAESFLKVSHVLVCIVIRWKISVLEANSWPYHKHSFHTSGVRLHGRTLRDSRASHSPPRGIFSVEWASSQHGGHRADSLCCNGWLLHSWSPFLCSLLVTQERFKFREYPTGGMAPQEIISETHN